MQAAPASACQCQSGLSPMSLAAPRDDALMIASCLAAEQLSSSLSQTSWGWTFKGRSILGTGVRRRTSAVSWYLELTLQRHADSQLQGIKAASRGLVHPDEQRHMGVVVIVQAMQDTTEEVLPRRSGVRKSAQFPKQQEPRPQHPTSRRHAHQS